MNDNALEIRRLVRCNRFLLALVALYTLITGFNFLEHRIITNAARLEVSWATVESTKNESALIFSSSQGGPFMVTQLATDDGRIDTALAAIAQLPHPLFVRGPKAVTYFSTRQMSQLKWINSEGKTMAAPKPHTPVMALYYEMKKGVTTEK